MWSMIEIRGLCKQFNNTVIFKDVDLDIKKGETTVILGGSGCGKSTLLRCINGLATADSGHIFVNGQDVMDPNNDVAAIRRKFGMVFQNFNLFSHLNVMENLILAPMQVLGLNQKEAIECADNLLEIVGMSKRRFHMPSQLSGGQKQRVAIARALAMEPEVMLFDEPTSALDPTMVDEVKNVILRLANNGMTCVIVTHEMLFARNVASKVVFMAEQGIYEQASPEEFFNHPAKELTRQFIYQSRIKEWNISQDNTDLYTVCSDLRAFAQPYGFTTKNAVSLDALCDELLYPMINASTPDVKEFFIRFLADETGDKHTLFIVFPNLKEDPLCSHVLDEINLSLLKFHLGSSIKSELKANGSWMVTCVL